MALGCVLGRMERWVVAVMGIRILPSEMDAEGFEHRCESSGEVW